MSFIYKKIAIIGKHYRKEISETVENIYHQLKILGLEIVLENKTAEDLDIANEKMQLMNLKDIAFNCDIAIIVGGDGSFLQASRVLALYSDIPVIGVNKGKFGFLTSISPCEKGFQDLLNILKGQNIQAKMSMLTCKVDDNDAPLEASVALNEIAITACRGIMLGLKVYIDHKYAFDQRGDGLIISTPTGSTGHAVSAGGPILNPNQNSIVLVPVCSHSLNSRPLVISNESVIDIYITDYNNPEPVLSIDGRHDTILKADQKITINKAHKKVTVLHKKDYNYYDTLREKLGWSKVLF